MNIHDRTRALAREKQMPIESAYRELSRRAASARQRRRDYGRVTVKPGQFWWMEQP